MYLGAVINIKINVEKNGVTLFKILHIAVGLFSSMYAITSTLKKSKQTLQNQTE